MRTTTFTGWMGAIALTAVVIGAGVAAGQGIGAIAARPDSAQQLAPADDFGVRHLQVSSFGLTELADYGVRHLRAEPADRLTPQDDYGVRQLDAVAPLTPQDDYGVRQLDR